MINRLASRLAALIIPQLPATDVEAEEIDYENQTFDEFEEIAGVSGLTHHQKSLLITAGVIRNDQEVAIFDDTLRSEHVS